VLYLSRSLSKAECKYSNIEREALANVWATVRARQFLLGWHFTLQTDHRPLEFLFDANKALPKVTSARIMRWALQLSAFDFSITHIDGKSIPHADAQSRFRFKESEFEENSEAFIHLVETDVLCLNDIRHETQQDHTLSSIFKRIVHNDWSRCSAAEKPFKSIRQKLSVESEIISRGDVIVPPQL